MYQRRPAGGNPAMDLLHVTETRVKLWRCGLSWLVCDLTLPLTPLVKTTVYKLCLANSLLPSGYSVQRVEYRNGTDLISIQMKI